MIGSRSSTPVTSRSLFSTKLMKCYPVDSKTKFMIFSELSLETFRYALLEMIQKPQGMLKIFRELIFIKVVLLSATMPNEILEVTKRFMREPIRILVKKEELTLEGIKQFYVNVEKEDWKVNLVFIEIRIFNDFFYLLTISLFLVGNLV